jgi:protein-L-isoaspartate(D-aspartate) O-methyltransferase
MRWRAALFLLVPAFACDEEPKRPPEPPPSEAPERPPGWPPQHKSDLFGKNREWMVGKQLVPRGISDTGVLRAMRTVPRHSFVPVDLRGHAYEDRPLPIGHDQTISQPFIVASMTEELRLKEGLKVLEIGTGSGYQAAVLAQITPHVFTIEIKAPLVVTAKGTLRRLGYTTVEVRHADGYYGWKEEAPFDAIMVTAAAPHVPPPLVEQLKPGGRMILPVGPPLGTQDLRLVTKDEKGRVRTRSLYDVRFVPLTGSLGEEKKGGAGGGEEGPSEEPKGEAGEKPEEKSGEGAGGKPD